jgi:hypothetical protein
MPTYPTGRVDIVSYSVPRLEHGIYKQVAREQNQLLILPGCHHHFFRNKDDKFTDGVRPIDAKQQN